MQKYNFYIAGNQVICVTRYADKTVKGIAKCSDQDTFNEEVGKELALARCKVKVAKKKADFATKRLRQADSEVVKALAKESKMQSYFAKAQKEFAKAIEECEMIASTL